MADITYRQAAIDDAAEIQPLVAAVVMNRAAADVPLPLFAIDRAMHIDYAVFERDRT